MSELTEQHTPSLAAGLQRFWRPVVIVVAVFGVLGLLYAVVSWTPTVTMTVGVDTATAPSTADDVDAERATREVAAQLASPAVVARAEADSGASLDSVSTFSEDQASTVEVFVTAGSTGAAEAGADALVPAYQAVTSETATAASEAAVASIDEVLVPLKEERDEVGAALDAAEAGSGSFTQLATDFQRLTEQIQDLESERSAAVLTATTSAVDVTVVGEPAVSGSRLGAIIRYVPVAMIGALVLCLLGIAVFVRRRPWVTSPETASEILGTPILAVGPRPSRFVPAPPVDIAPAVALGVQHALPGGAGLVSFVPVGQSATGGLPQDLVDRTWRLVHHVAEVVRHAGYSVVVAEVSGDGRTQFSTDKGPVLDAELPWVDSARNGAELLVALKGRRIEADLVIATLAVDATPSTVLELIEGSDGTVLVVVEGEWVEPLVATRRELAAFNRSPIGLVVDPPR